MNIKREVQADSFNPSHPSVYGAEREMTLYYDETNNIGKLRLRENGLNVSKHDNFVLGGIVLLPGQSIGNIHELRKDLHIQPNAEEIKFDMVAKNDFEKVLGSRKLTKVMQWLRDRGIGIHYMNLNVLNWVILDIVESIVANDAFADALMFQRELKNELHYIATRDLPRFLTIMQSHGFPDILREKTGDFIRAVYAFVLENWPEEPNGATDMLRRLLSRATSLDELIFLIGGDSGLLIGGFSEFFLSRICTFKNACHILDEEKEVQAALAHFRIMNGLQEMQVSFVDSKKVPEIQFSDVVVGLLGKYFSFVEKTPFSKLMTLRSGLSPVQKKNIELLGELISISNNVSDGLFSRVTTIDSDWKSDAFLFGRRPPPHVTNR